MAKRIDPADKVMDAALTLAETRPWGQVTLSELAEAAGVSMGEMRRAFPSKLHVLAGLMARTDRSVLDDTPPEAAGEPVKDRLMDILMRRLEDMTDRRAAVRSMLGEMRRDPGAALLLSPALARSMRWMLEAAGIPGHGLAGGVRARILSLVYLRSVGVWLDDDSEDLGRTMASLDKGLDRAMGMIGR